MSTTDQGIASKRMTSVMAAILVALGIGGFLVGVGPADELTADPHVVDRPGPRIGAAMGAPSYLDMPSAAQRPGGLDPHRLGLLHVEPSGTPATAPTPEEWQAGIEFHMTNRAWDGAPPTIPHPIRDQGFPECLACHADGLAVDGRVAPVPSHASLTSCTQCHVLAQQAFGAGPSEGVLEHAQSVGGTNQFGGYRWPERGQRAWPGAPPTMPHPLAMRTECLSCHGVLGPEGLRTSHPERASCLQCHALDTSIVRLPVPDAFTQVLR